MTQTAVEWLVGELNQKIDFIPMEKWDMIRNIVQQALAMEKEQIVKAVYDSMGTNFDPNMGRAELYYDETYGKSNI
jgi:hypothetical protein